MFGLLLMHPGKLDLEWHCRHGTCCQVFFVCFVIQADCHGSEVGPSVLGPSSKQNFPTSIVFFFSISGSIMSEQPLSCGESQCKYRPAIMYVYRFILYSVFTRVQTIHRSVSQLFPQYNLPQMPNQEISLSIDCTFVRQLNIISSAK